MCGICGYFRLNGAGASETATLRHMADVLRHRGPDDEGFFVDEMAAIANRRLSIVDLPGGHQPISNEDRTLWVVFNGEVYNQADLRRELEGLGHRFSTRSDTEVLVHLWEEWGEEGVHRLNGMFAFALWDSRTRQAWLVRDRLGVKPLYWLRRPEALVFGSEVKALLAYPGVTAELDLEALGLYLALRYVPDSRVICAGMAKVPPGHLLMVEPLTGRVELKRYWAPELLAGDAPCRREEELSEELLFLLQDAVTIRLMSDVPFGAFLSGGLDSSAIVALMSRTLDQPVRTFSIGFSEQGSLDETGHARLVAAAFDTRHREVDCTADKVELLPKLLSHFDEPFADPIIVPTYQVSELAASEVKVVLTGEGADEVFGGYTRFVSDQHLRRLARVPAGIRQGLLAIASRIPGTATREQVTRGVQMSGLPEAARFLAWVSAFSEQDQTELCVPEVRAAAGNAALELYRRYVVEAAGTSATNRMLYCDAMVRLPECMLARTDRMTMAVSLEGRTPFLDYRLVEWAMRLPGRLKVRGDREKYILKKALSGVLPPKILGRRKQGLAVPFAQWTRYGVERHIRRILSRDRVERRGLFVPRYVEGLIDHWGPHASRHSQLVWSLLCLELWCRIYLDRDLDPATPLSSVE